MKNENYQKMRIFNPDIKLPKYGVLIDSRMGKTGSANAAHKHNYPSILYVVSGEGVFECDGKKFQVDTNSIITLEKGKIHKLSDKLGKTMTVFSVYFDTTISEINKEIVEILFASTEPFELPLYYSENIKRYLRQMLYEQTTKPPGYELSIKQILSLTLLQIYRAVLEFGQKKLTRSLSSRERVKDVIDFITKNCHEQYGLADAARLGKVSQRQFTNLCRSITGKSFIRFLNSVRCQKAAELLKGTNMSAAAVSFEVGYEELSTFYRAFKKIYKSSPIRFKTTVCNSNQSK